jgi:hypothetical protein
VPTGKSLPGKNGLPSLTLSRKAELDGQGMPGRGNRMKIDKILKERMFTRFCLKIVSCGFNVPVHALDCPECRAKAA